MIRRPVPELVGTKASAAFTAGLVVVVVELVVEVDELLVGCARVDSVSAEASSLVPPSDATATVANKTKRAKPRDAPRRILADLFIRRSRRVPIPTPPIDAPPASPKEVRTIPVLNNEIVYTRIGRQDSDPKMPSN